MPIDDLKLRIGAVSSGVCAYKTFVTARSDLPLTEDKVVDGIVCQRSLRNVVNRLRTPPAVQPIINAAIKKPRNVSRHHLRFAAALITSLANNHSLDLRSTR